MGLREREREREKERVEVMDSKIETTVKKVEKKQETGGKSSEHIYCVAIFTI